MCGVPRKTPYTDRGVRRLPCTRCGKPALTQWQICADGNQYRPLCLACDHRLNAMVMKWVGLPFDAIEYLKHLRDLRDG